MPGEEIISSGITDMTHVGMTSDATPGDGLANVLIVDDESMTRSLVSKKVALLKANAIEAEDGV